MTAITQSIEINGINTEALRGAIEAITEDPANGKTHWEVTTHWKGGTRSDTHVKSCTIGNDTVLKDFVIKIDEPTELCGSNQYANPQEYLLAALNACMVVGYTACCSLEGIQLDSLSIQTEGEIDLQGFLSLDAAVVPGYEELRYTVKISGDGTPDQFEKIHKTVMNTSPNYFNITNPVPLRSRLVLV